MKLVVDASAIRPSKLTVVNGDDIVYTTEVYGKDLENAIDKIFKEKYIESVQFKQYNNYTQKFIDYVENTHPSVMVLFNNIEL